jgi:hypothetical protein
MKKTLCAFLAAAALLAICRTHRKNPPEPAVISNVPAIAGNDVTAEKTSAVPVPAAVADKPVASVAPSPPSGRPAAAVIRHEAGVSNPAGRIVETNVILFRPDFVKTNANPVPRQITVSVGG